MNLSRFPAAPFPGPFRTSKHQFPASLNVSVLSIPRSIRCINIPITFCNQPIESNISTSPHPAPSVAPARQSIMTSSRLVLIAVFAALLIVPAPAARTRARRVRRGTATIESGDSNTPAIELPTALLGLPTAPISLAKLQQASQQPVDGELPLAAAAAVTPQAKSQIKRIFLQNKCDCKNNATDAAYPVVALSYQPVQAVDFYTVGYWSASCTKTYVIATTNSVVYMSAEMSDGSVTWTGDTSLTVYVPSQNTCEEPRKFKEYKLPLNWNDHTITLTC